MDAETKRRIDNARDALVGKVPDPKGQVEQITIALTYKFMDDMDLRAVELGGKRQFFADDFAQYAWSKLMDPGLGAQEMLKRYSNGIDRMSDNPGAEPLFRTIFANAFLPYNDPSTLQQFLRVINEFEYDNSETLGDAYEYLTSIMGSQGEAGQFRTPRHIIEFIVDIVDPKLGDRILDPACGTGGFLIAAYQHILGANTNGESTLTPREKAKLADSLTGYDIDPGMVQIALLNMYLHGLVDPHIHEYDTLTSEERWSEYADVIIANPPFMTPKGGIRPHSKFGVQSKRSEVLFVDYMAEHLTSNGRAGIVVPEGIIFQAQNAHKALRKMLVEDYLIAVVSLPGGVFNPYSGVKTSILILDKALARYSDNIGFFKVQNDGFDLGAQRRSIEQDDLPQVLDDVREYLRRSRDYELTDGWSPATGHVVLREKIAADGEYNLSGERYRVRTTRASKYPMVRLRDVAEVIAGQSPPGSSYNNTGDGEPFHQGKTEFGEVYIGQATKWTTDPRRFAYPGDVIMSVRAPVGPVNLTKDKICIGRGLAAIRPDHANLTTEFAYYILRQMDGAVRGSGGTAFDSISIKAVGEIELPLPPLDVQRELVAEIEGYQRVIDGARLVVESWRPRLEVDPGWPVVELGEVCERRNGAVKPSELSDVNDYIGLENIESGTGVLLGVGDPTSVKSAKTKFRHGDILFGKLRPNLNKVWLSDRQGVCSTDIFALEPSNPQVDPTFFAHLLRSDDFNSAAVARVSGAQLPRISWQSFATLPVPLPPLETQQRIAVEIAEEQAAVDANRGLVGRMEGRVRDVVGRVWG